MVGWGRNSQEAECARGRFPASASCLWFFNGDKGKERKEGDWLVAPSLLAAPHSRAKDSIVSLFYSSWSGSTDAHL